MEQQVVQKPVAKQPVLSQQKAFVEPGKKNG